MPLIYRYFRDQLGFRIGDCCLDVALNYTVDAMADGEIAAHVANLNVSSRNIDLRALDSDDSILQLPELRVSGGDARKLLNIFELIVNSEEEPIKITNDMVMSKIQKNTCRPKT